MSRLPVQSREIVDLLPRLRRFCVALTGNGADADDLAQATVERAIRRMHQFEKGSRMDRWLIRIAHNVWIDELRTGRSRARHVDIDQLEGAIGDDGVETVERRDAMAKVRMAVARLPVDQRDVVAMVLVEGFSYRDAAEALDVPIGTVMSRLSRARSTLATTLTAQGVAA
jgi:RNA polymerase sigma-70 factor (ECF subfamily)